MEKNEPKNDELVRFRRDRAATGRERARLRPKRRSIRDEKGLVADSDELRTRTLSAVRGSMGSD